LSEETIVCPNCGYAMQDTYTRTKNHNGKRTWKATGTKLCDQCNVEKHSTSTKIIT
jgi:C4-type Zn-finger protein